MGWFKSLVTRAAKYAGIPLRDPALARMLGNAPTTSGVDIDEISALNYSAVWAAVGILSSNVACMPAYPVEMKGEEHRIAMDHWSYDLLCVQPNPEMTPFTLTETMQAHALTWGNGYARLIRAAEDMPATGIQLLPPNQTEPYRTGGRIKYHFNAKFEGETDEDYESWEVLHLAGMGFDGLKGYPVIEHAAESVGLLGATEKYGAAFFGRGSAPGGILELPEGADLSEKAKKNLRESFELMHRGPDNAHRIAVLEDGVTYKTIGLPLETAQFLQTRLFQIVEVARWFNVPPHMLRDLTHATYSNIEHQSIDFLVYSLRPWLIRWQQEYRRKLFTPIERRRFKVQHDTSNLLMTDMKSRYDAYRVGRDSGMLTLDMIAKMEHQNPVGGKLGGSRLVPINMRAVDADGNDVFEDVADGGVELTAMNGIQVTAMLQIVEACAAKTVDPDSAEAMLKIAFPDVPQNLIADMLKPIREGKVDVPAEPASGTPPVQSQDGNAE